VVPDKIWTAEEQAALSPAEQDALFEARIAAEDLRSAS
jgi:hypothetical protein